MSTHVTIGTTKAMVHFVKSRKKERKLGRCLFQDSGQSKERNLSVSIWLWHDL